MTTYGAQTPSRQERRKRILDALPRLVGQGTLPAGTAVLLSWLLQRVDEERGQ